MALFKAGLVMSLITASVALAFSTLILCHEMGPTTPGDTTQRSDDVLPITWQVTESPNGYLYARVATYDNSTYDEGDSNRAVRQLRIIDGKPQEDCCHGVQLRGTSWIQIDLYISWPKPNDISFAEVGSSGQRAYTRWIGAADGCGAAWGNQQTLEVYARLQYVSENGAGPIRSFAGEWREILPNQAPVSTPMTDTGGMITVSKTTDYSQTPIYVCTTTLEVVNSCRAGTTNLVRTDAPPYGVPADQARSWASFTCDVTEHRLTDTNATCAAHSP